MKQKRKGVPRKPRPGPEALRNRPKLSHAARILRIREMLDSGESVTINQLRRTFGVSRRTLYYDLKALKEAGAMVFSEPDSEGETRWKLDRPSPRTMSPPQAARKLTIGQLLSLGLATGALSFLEGTELHDELVSVMDSLQEGLSPANRDHARKLGKKLFVVHSGHKSYREKLDILDDILSGLLHEQLVELDYRPIGKKVRKHLVEPYTLMVYAESLYLICFSRTREEHRIFAVDRVRSSRWLRGQRFDFPEDYTPEQFTDGAFGIVGGETTSVEILFDPDEARYVKERNWHPTQKFEKTPDGRVRMRMTLSGTGDLLLWLLGRAESIEIVKPAWLREQARKTLEKAAARHAGNATRHKPS